MARIYTVVLTTALLLSSACGLLNDATSSWDHNDPLSTKQCHSIATHLRPRLSPEATIVLPGNDVFLTLETRASSPRISSGFTAIVEVATEEDVKQTVRLQSIMNCQNRILKFPPDQIL